MISRWVRQYFEHHAEEANKTVFRAHQAKLRATVANHPKVDRLIHAAVAVLNQYPRAEVTGAVEALADAVDAFNH